MGEISIILLHCSLLLSWATGLTNSNLVLSTCIGFSSTHTFQLILFLHLILMVTSSVLLFFSPNHLASLFSPLVFAQIPSAVAVVSETMGNIIFQCDDGQYSQFILSSTGILFVFCQQFAFNLLLFWLLVVNDSFLIGLYVVSFIVPTKSLTPMKKCYDQCCLMSECWACRKNERCDLLGHHKCGNVKFYMIVLLTEF